MPRQPDHTTALEAALQSLDHDAYFLAGQADDLESKEGDTLDRAVHLTAALVIGSISKAVRAASQAIDPTPQKPVKHGYFGNAD